MLPNVARNERFSVTLRGFRLLPAGHKLHCCCGITFHLFIVINIVMWIVSVPNRRSRAVGSCWAMVSGCADLAWSSVRFRGDMLDLAMRRKGVGKDSHVFLVSGKCRGTAPRVWRLPTKSALYPSCDPNVQRALTDWEQGIAGSFRRSGRVGDLRGIMIYYVQNLRFAV